MVTAGSSPVLTTIDSKPSVLPVQASRLGSVDILRGLVMVIMALDHTRDFMSELRFAPEDLAHTFEFTTDGQQIKPRLTLIKQWLRQHIKPELMRKGVVMGRDNSGASDSVSDELVRVGIAEAYSETQVQITSGEFRALGLLGVVEAAEPKPL